MGTNGEYNDTQIQSHAPCPPSHTHGTKPHLQSAQTPNKPNPVEHKSPNNPAEPKSPNNPAEPKSPHNPVEPKSPHNPAEPKSPHNPAEPKSPHNPAEPKSPHNPAEPKSPHNPAEPKSPHNPAEPKSPHNPAEPKSPHNPAEPKSPHNPAEPKSPHNPAEPKSPHNPTEPCIVPRVQSGKGATSHRGPPTLMNLVAKPLVPNIRGTRLLTSYSQALLEGEAPNQGTDTVFLAQEENGTQNWSPARIVGRIPIVFVTD
uniref:Uncharacterized protein n=1 Tax=Xenopus tropicalis TaxID=8364 RepID=A0A1B8Y4X2_XENTR